MDYTSIDAADLEADWQLLSNSLNMDGRTRVFYLATTPLIYVATCQA
ncbi:MAG: hypothetical protein JKY25_08850 [Robiginitomaculum sp.]|nr:hypothetical protein [Robiginitomaculum sp.]